MDQKKLSTILNSSNQANVHSANQSGLSQFNFVVILGLEHLRRDNGQTDEIPVSINITRSGELEINGLDKDILSDENNIRVYSDKKMTCSKEE
ncbi:hypothetical protein [Petroclostridium xylanilyticum]|uniref:hypothetical protein n=1 Tax=Petroclostridium xylanilyticum TaxID=1792311 RepID=UPI000B99850C|nr:hypothetical protein [Petroclostridium xylanilyticum]